MKFVSKISALVVCSFALSMSASAGWGYKLGKDGNCYKTYDGAIQGSEAKAKVHISNCQKQVVNNKSVPGQLNLSPMNKSAIAAPIPQRSISNLPVQQRTLLLNRVAR